MSSEPRAIPASQREEIAVLMSTLRPFDANHFRDLTDEQLLAEVRALPSPLMFTGKTLKTIARLVELLQEIENEAPEKTRTEYEYLLMQLQAAHYATERWLFGVLGAFAGVALLIFGAMFVTSFK